MKRFARLAGLPILVAATLLGTAVSTGAVGTAAAAGSCSGVMSYNYTRVTVACSADSPGNRFRAVAYCPNALRYGPWVFQGPGHVSVATCANPMGVWDAELAY